MALVLGTDCGFVTVAPTADPGGFESTSSNNTLRVTGDTSSASATLITEVGWRASSQVGANENPSYSVGLYADSAGVPGALLESSTGHTTSGASSWQVVTGLNWTISSSTKYWIAFWIDGTTDSVGTKSITSGAAGRDTKTTGSLDNPFDGGALADPDAAYGVYALLQGTVTYDEEVDDTVTLSESITPTYIHDGIFSEEIDETITLSETITPTYVSSYETFSKEVEDSITFSEDITTTYVSGFTSYTKEIDETITLGETIDVTYISGYESFSEEIDDTITLSEDITIDLIHPGVFPKEVEDSITFSEDISVTQVKTERTYSESVDDTITLSETITPNHEHTITKSINIEDSLTLSESIEVRQSTGTTNLELSDSLSLSEISSTVNLVAHYKMNDNLATTNVIDSIGSNDGTATDNTDTLSTAGKINLALNFNGTDERVLSNQNILLGQGTISLWFNKLGVTGDEGTVAVTCNANKHSRTRLTVSDIGTVAVVKGDPISTVTLGSVNDGEWHHQVLCWEETDSTTGNFWGYLDGVKSSIDTFDHLQQAHSNTNIGALSATNDNFNGDIDDVRLFNKVLSQIDIDNIYNDGTGTEDETFSTINIEHVQTQQIYAENIDETITLSELISPIHVRTPRVQNMEDSITLSESIAIAKSSKSFIYSFDDTTTFSEDITITHVQTQQVYTENIDDTLSLSENISANLSNKTTYLEVEDTITFSENVSRTHIQIPEITYKNVDETVTLSETISATLTRTVTSLYTLQDINQTLILKDQNETSSYKSELGLPLILENQSDWETIKPNDISGCVAYWDFNEGTGSLTYDAIGNVAGSLISGATWGIGRFGSCVVFNGSTNAVQCNFIGSHFSAKPGTNVTVSVWFNTVGSSLGISGGTQVIIGGAMGTWETLGLGRRNLTNLNKLHLRTDDSWLDPAGTPDVGSNIWKHTVATMEVNSGSPYYPNVSIYLDGNLIETGSYLYRTGNPNWYSPAFIGFDNRFKFAFNGKIDEVALWDRILVDEEIRQIYNRGYPQFNTIKDLNSNNIIIREVI